MKILFTILGFISLGFAILGIYLPLLPATPFLLLSTACFAKSSSRFQNWFLSTKLYKNNVKPIVNKQGMTMQRKYKILASVSLIFIVSILLVPHPHSRIALAVILIGHWLYFIFKIKTVEKDENDAQ